MARPDTILVDLQSASCPPHQNRGYSWSTFLACLPPSASPSGWEYAVIVEDPVGLGVDKYDPHDWVRLYSGASGIVRKKLTRTPKKTDSDATSHSSQDGTDEQLNIRSRGTP